MNNTLDYPLPNYLTSLPVWTGSVLETIHTKTPQIWEEAIDNQLRCFEKYSAMPDYLNKVELELFEALQKYAVQYLVH